MHALREHRQKLDSREVRELDFGGGRSKAGLTLRREDTESRVTFDDVFQLSKISVSCGDMNSRVTG